MAHYYRREGVGTYEVRDADGTLGHVWHGRSAEDWYAETADGRSLGHGWRSREAAARALEMDDRERREIPNCCYCGEPLTPNEIDPESGFYGSYHYRCSAESADGEWYVRTVQNAATPPREHVRRYTNEARAVAEAEHTRRWNRRDWPCGAALDIFVGRYAPCICAELGATGLGQTHTRCEAHGRSERAL